MGQRSGAVATVGVSPFGGIYGGRRVLVTGHTGFKGSWLSLWLEELGASVTGLALAPEAQPNHWALLRLKARDVVQDVREAERVAALVREVRPEIVFHLAAQSLVRRSYANPLENWCTNVLGTANVLDACRGVDGLKAIVVTTTDKVYANEEWPWGYRENDRLGGHDPYSASKAACEILIESYRKCYFADASAPLLASARAGNVIGGGDWAEDRLVPDAVRAVGRKEPLVVRYPRATRPWQHVLECLTGYLLLGQKLLEGEKRFADAWNFGPSPEDNRTVGDVLALLQEHWPQLTWKSTDEPQPHEATLLYLDNSKARSVLGWKPVWTVGEALQATADWYRRVADGGAVESRQQLERYVACARDRGAVWT